MLLHHDQALRYVSARFRGLNFAASRHIGDVVAFGGNCDTKQRASPCPHGTRLVIKNWKAKQLCSRTKRYCKSEGRHRTLRLYRSMSWSKSIARKFITQNQSVGVQKCRSASCNGTDMKFTTLPYLTIADPKILRPRMVVTVIPLFPVPLENSVHRLPESQKSILKCHVAAPANISASTTAFHLVKGEYLPWLSLDRSDISFSL